MANRITLDRDACEGVFACLVRDDRFVEAADGLAGLAIDDTPAATAADGGDVVTAVVDEDAEAARGAAAACPFDAIEVEAVDAAEVPDDE
jgi:ferredoxin